jgi:hypothetical protein
MFNPNRLSISIIGLVLISLLGVIAKQPFAVGENASSGRA